jgi:hypothetical protein
MLGNSCYQLVQELVSSSVLSTDIKIKIHRTIICILFYPGVKLDLSNRESNIGRGCSRIGC